MRLGAKVMSLQSWCERFAEDPDLHWYWQTDYDSGEGAWLLMARMRQLVERDDVVLKEEQWEDVLRRAASHADGILEDVTMDRSERVAFLQTLARLVVKVRELSPERDGGVHMFWEFILYNYLDRDPSPELRDAFHRVLAEQLRMPDKRLQMSALYGLNYLSQADSRVADLVREVRPRLADDEVREFADNAVRGDLW